MDVIATYIIPLVNELERDPIPNIRFNVAKTHQRIPSKVPPNARINTLVERRPEWYYITQ